NGPWQRQQEDRGHRSEYRIRVEVGRLTSAEKSQPVLVDEVEPEELLLPQSGDEMPGSGDGQKEKQPRNAPGSPQPVPVADDERVGEDDESRNRQTHEPLGQDREGEGRITGQEPDPS